MYRFYVHKGKYRTTCFETFSLPEETLYGKLMLVEILSFLFIICNPSQWTILLKTSHFSVSWYKHSHKKRKDSLEGSLNQLFFATELEFPKILVPMLLHNSSNVNTGCAGKSEQLYSLYDQLLETYISSFCHSGINLFLIHYACCKLCDIWLLLLENNTRS